MTRDEALKKMQAVKSYMTSGNPIWSVTEIGEAFDMAIEALEQPERKTGKWIWHWDKFDIDTASEAECSRCKKISAMPVGYFCKWCGADMRGEEDG